MRNTLIFGYGIKKHVFTYLYILRKVASASFSPAVLCQSALSV